MPPLPSQRPDDSGVIARAAEAARAVPGVDGVTVRVARRAGQAPEPPAAPPAGEDGDRPPAQVDAEPMVLPAAAPVTLVEALVRAAEGDRGTTYVLGDGSEVRQTYRDLLADAARVLPGLRADGLLPGDAVLLHCDDNRNFVTGFWACLLGGFVPTPIGMAQTYRWDNAATRRMRNAWDLLEKPPILTDDALLAQVGGLRTLWGTGDLRVLSVEGARAAEPATDLYEGGPEDPVVYLLTSGSTGTPKCVRHVNRTVVTRAYANADINGFGADDVTLNFMPLDHVAGMVMHNLRDVILQCEHVNARTDAFIADPLRWFTWIERYRVTNTSAPNFVITLVTNLADEIARGGWDLSTLRDITNGGEAIVSRTMHDFLRLTAPQGMAPDVMRPAWGMSEMCGGVVHSTLRGDDETAGVVTVDHRTTRGTLTLLPGPATGHPTYTEVGVPIRGTSLRIAGPDGRVLTEDRIGRLQVRGVTRMTGYHNNPRANEEAFTADGWFDTGDLAFVHEGRLVMTGREKDMIVIRSANYPCHEIESVVERIDGVLPTFVAACSEHDADAGTDELVIFAVLAAGEPHARRAVVETVAARISRELGLRPRRVVPVPQDAFPKTSAGKIERARLLADYQAGAFDAELAALAGIGEDDAPWLFGTSWVPADAVPGSAPGGAWLVFDHDDLAGDLRALRGSGTVVRVTPGTGFTRGTGTGYAIDPADPADYTALLAAVEREHGPVGAIVHAWATRRYDDGPEAYTRGLELAAPSVHGLLKAAGEDVPLLVVTTGACAAGDADPVEPVHATVHGLVRTANAEGRKGWLRHLDLRAGDPDPAAAVMAELADAGGEQVVARRPGRRLAPRVRPLDETPSAAHRIREGGLYLVTGGLGGVGSRIAEFLLREYGAALVLNGRSAPDAGRIARLADLGDVTYHRGDVADAGALREAVTAAERRTGRTLNGVFHVAGAPIAHYWRDLDAHLLAREDTAEFTRMYRAKVLGTRAVAEVLADRPDALLVLCSSVNGYFGGTGFGAYSSASGFLPAFAEHRRRLGRPAQCHAWSMWAGSESRAEAEAVRRHGFRPIDPGHGTRLMAAALADPAAHVLIGLDDRNEHVERELDPAFLGRVEVTVAYRGRAPREAVRDAVAAALGGVRVRAEPAVEENRADAVGDVERVVADAWARALGRPSVGRDAYFFELGGNSLVALRLVDRLNTEFGVRMTVHQLFENPTVEQLAREIGRIAASPAAE